LCFISLLTAGAAPVSDDLPPVFESAAAVFAVPLHVVFSGAAADELLGTNKGV
jgi:hypothetical protein